MLIQPAQTILCHSAAEKYIQQRTVTGESGILQCSACVGELKSQCNCMQAAIRILLQA